MLHDQTHDCVEVISHSNIAVSEKGKTANFKNPHRAKFQRIRVDGCLVKNGPRADWIVTKEGDRSVIIELKGRDVEHACEQVFATASHASCIPWLQQPVKLLIVCSQVPAFNTKVARYELKARKLGLSLRLVCKRVDCAIEQV